MTNHDVAKGLDSGRPTVVRCFQAFEICVAFLTYLTVAIVCLTLANMKFDILAQFRSVGSPTMSIMLGYYLLVLPILFAIFLLSRRCHHVTSLVVVAIVTMVLVLAWADPH